MEERTKTIFKIIVIVIAIVLIIAIGFQIYRTIVPDSIHIDNNKFNTQYQKPQIGVLDLVNKYLSEIQGIYFYGDKNKLLDKVDKDFVELYDYSQAVLDADLKKVFGTKLKKINKYSITTYNNKYIYTCNLRDFDSEPNNDEEIDITIIADSDTYTFAFKGYMYSVELDGSYQDDDLAININRMYIYNDKQKYRLSVDNLTNDTIYLNNSGENSTFYLHNSQVIDNKLLNILETNADNGNSLRLKCDPSNITNILLTVDGALVNNIYENLRFSDIIKGSSVKKGISIPLVK